MQDFRNLDVWRRGHALTLEVYRQSAAFPREETYGLRGQVRRSSSSIPTNIAEGCGCASNAEYARFLGIAFRSAIELEYQLLLARDLGYWDDLIHRPLTDETVELKKMLATLIKRISS